MLWIKLAEKFWVSGLHDKHALRRHKQVFETLVEVIKREPAIVDFNEIALQLTYFGKEMSHRKIALTMSRLHGRAQIDRWSFDEAHPETSGIKATPAAIRVAIAWMDEKKAKAEKVEGRKRVSKKIENV